MEQTGQMKINSQAGANKVTRGRFLGPGRDGRDVLDRRNSPALRAITSGAMIIEFPWI